MQSQFLIMNETFQSQPTPMIKLNQGLPHNQDNNFKTCSPFDAEFSSVSYITYK